MAGIPPLPRPESTILAIGHRSFGVVNGLSVAFETLIAGLKERSIRHHIVNAGAGTSARSSGVVSLRRVRGVVRILSEFFRHVRTSHVVYLTIGDSKPGFVRDAIMIWCGVMLGRRIVLHLHGGGYKPFYDRSGPLWRAAIRCTFGRADAVIVLGMLLRDQFSFLKRQCAIVVVPNGFPGELPSRSDPKQLGSPLRLLYLSNMIPSKGYAEVLEACRVLKQRGRIGFVCDFAGAFLSVGSISDSIAPKEAERRFLSRVESYGLADTVRYHGFVGPAAKDGLLAGAHVLVLPTRYPGEGQPISIIEALGRGIPVVSTWHAAIPEMVEDGRNGILLNEPTGERIADAIEAVASDAERYMQMSVSALEIFEARFTKDRYVDDLIAVILGACPTDRAA